MSSLFKKVRTASSGAMSPASTVSPKAKKEEPAPELTPLEKMLQNAGPLRQDGSDKFFGMENFGNTCYCNSIVQALYYSEPFRDSVVNYPPFSPSDTPNGLPSKVPVQIRPPMNGNTPSPQKQKGITAKEAMAQRKAINQGQVAPGQQRPEDKPDSPEYKKKQAMIKGPVLELAQENAGAFGMDECTFTGLKDIFQAMIESSTRTGVLSPQRFLEIFKRDNEMFRNSMHQDAHEFYGLVLNDVISNVEANARRVREREETRGKDGLAESVQNALGASAAVIKSQQQASGTRSPGTGWVHDIFEGVLTSETKCLTCETASQRDETFLDLSIDLEEHSSVTSCLRKFSAEEMLCERNKFHCDRCGGLQEAEKRMKIKKLPKVLALHLKRFKYTEDYSRLQKLFHRVVYPYHLRMFNTTDDADDPDRLYELYAVVVHIGGNAYHGHYVSVIKTADRGWLLFDDEMVEPVDKHFVRNFFGEKPGMACAYVLFYQETTFEKVLAEQEAEGLEEVRLVSEKADIALGNVPNAANGSAPLSKHMTVQPISPVEENEPLATLNHAQTAPDITIAQTAAPPSQPEPYSHPLRAAPPPAPAVVTKADQASKPSKEDKEREKKEAKAMEKARKVAEKEQAKENERKRKERDIRLRDARQKEQDELKAALAASKASAAEDDEKRKKEEPSAGNSGFLNRSNRGSKSLSRKSFGFLAKDKPEKVPEGIAVENGHSAEGRPSQSQEKPLKERFSFGLGRKKSNNVLS